MFVRKISLEFILLLKSFESVVCTLLKSRILEFGGVVAAEKEGKEREKKEK